MTLGILNLMHGKILPGALPAGKISTAVLFVSLVILVLFPEMNAGTVEAIAIVDGIFLTASFFCYLIAYCGKHPLLQDLNPD